MKTAIPNPSNPTATNLALAVAPAATGAAVGILLAETLGREGRRNTALGLLGIAALATIPYLSNYVVQLVNGPNSRWGSRRTLARIRDGIAAPQDYEGYNFDDIENEDLPPVAP